MDRRIILDFAAFSTETNPPGRGRLIRPSEQEHHGIAIVSPPRIAFQHEQTLVCFFGSFVVILSVEAVPKP